MRAVKRFKALLYRKRPELMQGIFGRASRIVQPPLSMYPLHALHKSKSVDTDDRRAIEAVLTVEGVHRDIKVSDDLKCLPEHMDLAAISKDKESTHDGNNTKGRSDEPPSQESSSRTTSKSSTSQPRQDRGQRHHQTSGKGQAHDPLSETHFLNIGLGDDDAPVADTKPCLVSESPKAIETNIYEKAYQAEVERIIRTQGKQATIFLTRRVEGTIGENEET